jgi:hypothetical protein
MNFYFFPILTMESNKSTASAHTTGPWHVEQCGDLLVTQVGGPTICELDPQPEAAANARLIAAAPDLLGALKDVSQSLSDFYDVENVLAGQHFGAELKHRMEAAIAAAEGSTSLTMTNAEKFAQGLRLLWEVSHDWDESDVAEYYSRFSFDELLAELSAIRFREDSSSAA